MSTQGSSSSLRWMAVGSSSIVMTRAYRASRRASSRSSPSRTARWRPNMRSVRASASAHRSLQRLGVRDTAPSSRTREHRRRAYDDRLDRREPDREHRRAVQRAAQLAQRVEPVQRERPGRRRAPAAHASPRTAARPRPARRDDPAEQRRELRPVDRVVRQVARRPRVRTLPPTRAQLGGAASPRPIAPRTARTTSGAKNTNAAVDDVGRYVAEHAGPTGDVEVDALRSRARRRARTCRDSVMKPAGDVDDRVARLVRGLLGRDRHERKNGFCGSPAASTSATVGVPSRPAVERGERRVGVVRVDRLFVVGVGIHPHRRDQQSVVGVASARTPLRTRRDHARGDAGLRGAPREPARALVRRSTAALLTNSVIGFTGTFGRATTTNGACPAAASPARSPTRRRPDRPSAPSTVLTCAAFGPSPAKPSPMLHDVHATAPVADFLQQLARHRARLRVVAEQRDEPRRRSRRSGSRGASSCGPRTPAACPASSAA